MKRPPRFSIVLLFLLVPAIGSLLPGCMATKERTELGPFYFRRELPRPEATESAILWPFFQKYESARISQFAFRPLVNVRREDTGWDLQGNIHEVQALWPLFLYRRTEGLTRLKIRLLPVFHHVRFQHADGPEEVDTHLLPFLLSGHSETGEDYFAIFPLGGTLRGFFGRERIRFALFPLYADTREGEHRSRHFLWPIFRHSHGGGKSSFRFFPLFGWKKKEGWYDKRFVLWPFFSRVQYRIGTDRPLDSWFFLPFYGRQETPFGKIQYFLYPFFSYHQNERPGNRFREWNLPWPIVRFTRGDLEHATQVWPIWGRHSKPNFRKEFLFYPIYHSFLYGDADRMMQRTYVLPLYWSWRVTEGGEFSHGRIKGWPLFDASMRGEEERQFRALSPLWFWRPDGGFERNYSDFWKFHEHRRWEDGLLERKILWARFFSNLPGAPGESEAMHEPGPEPAEPPGEPERSSPWDAGFLHESPPFQGLLRGINKLGLE